MAKRIGSVNFFVNANTAKFQRGMKNASRSASIFGRGLSRLTGILNKFGAALGVGSAIGFGILLKRQAEFLDQLAKMSDKLNLAPRQLAGLQLGAKLAGASVEDINKAMELFVARLGEAATGTGEAKDALEKLLKLDIKRLTQLPTFTALTEVTDAITDLSQRSSQLSALRDIFGRGGLKVGNLILQGSESLRKAVEEFKELGGTFTRRDLAKVERFNDAMTRLGVGLKNLLRAITIELAPFGEVVTNALKRLFGGGGLQETIRNTLRAVGFSVAAFLDGMNDLLDKLVRSTGFRVLFGDPTGIFGINAGGPIANKRPGDTGFQGTLSLIDPRAAPGAVTRGPFGQALAKFFEAADAMTPKKLKGGLLGGTLDTLAEKMTRAVAGVKQNVSSLSTRAELGILGMQPRFAAAGGGNIGRQIADDVRSASRSLKVIERGFRQPFFNRNKGGVRIDR